MAIDLIMNILGTIWRHTGTTSIATYLRANGVFSPTKIYAATYLHMMVMGQSTFALILTVITDKEIKSCLSAGVIY